MLEPQYILAARPVGRLAYGELAVEPALGPVRVAAVKPESRNDPDLGFVRIRWRDERGPGTAACRYPAHRSFLVQMPALVDRLLVRRGIDQAARNRREVSDGVARLIASHLHAGPGSALERFMIDGSITERTYEELENAVRHRLYTREWVHALTRYCLGREDTGPAWTRRTMPAGEARAVEWLAFAGVDVDGLKRSGENRGDWHRHYPMLLTHKQISTQMAAQLIDAAFLLGLTTARRRVLPPLAQERLGELMDAPSNGNRAATGQSSSADVAGPVR